MNHKPRTLNPELGTLNPGSVESDAVAAFLVASAHRTCKGVLTRQSARERERDQTYRHDRQTLFKGFFYLDYELKANGEFWPQMPYYEESLTRI